MSLPKLIVNYADYNYWANQKLVSWLSAYPDALLHQESPSSYSSLIKTLNHIWGAEAFWYAKIAEVEDFEQRYHVENFDTQEITYGLLNRSKCLQELMRSYTQTELGVVIKIVTPWFQSEFPRYEYLQHVVNHGTYHRGQLVTIGRSLGITDAPMTDYNFYLLDQIKVA